MGLSGQQPKQLYPAWLRQGFIILFIIAFLFVCFFRPQKYKKLQNPPNKSSRSAYFSNNFFLFLFGRLKEKQ
jgi:hypothetical protein